jgi:hypothetical protein
MKKLMLGILFALFVFAPTVDQTSAVQASEGEPTVVFNGGSCGIGGYGGVYQGETTQIMKDGKLSHYSCNAFLVRGTAVSRTVQFHSGEGHWVFTPGGHASAVYPRGF